jgi:GTPase SAR1 family protein
MGYMPCGVSIRANGGLKNVSTDHLQELRTHTDSQVVGMLVGNKCDLRHQQVI